jgi:hypothetical protein
MRVFTNNIQTLISSDNKIDFFFLITLNLNLTYRLSSLSFDTAYDGNTFLASGAILSVDSPRISSVLDRDSYTIVVADPDDELLAEARTGIVGKGIEVRVGFFNSNGVPLLNVNDTVPVYKGYVDSPQIINDFESKTLSIEGTSPMSDLDLMRAFYTTSTGMDQFDLTDTCFDRIHEGYDLQIRWGKV